MEQQVFDCIKDMTKEDVFIYTDYLHLDKKKNFYNIGYFEFLVCAIFIKQQNCYLRIPANYSYLFNNDYLSKVSSEPDFIRVHFSSILDIKNMEEPILHILKSISAPPTFDVCSRYNECSDAMHCLMPDKRHSLECTYRKKLQEGIVFFGKNRNID